MVILIVGAHTLLNAPFFVYAALEGGEPSPCGPLDRKAFALITHRPFAHCKSVRDGHPTGYPFGLRRPHPNTLRSHSLHYLVRVRNLRYPACHILDSLLGKTA
jgi:hypothetical protein